jgi:hypothetical protein
MLLTGEHIILDVDHRLMFLRLIASSPEKETFWNEHKEVARAHWEQLKTKVHTPEEMLARLEVCNFYRLTKNAPNDFTLVLVSEVSKEFIRIFLEEYFAAMGVKGGDKRELNQAEGYGKTWRLKGLARCLLLQCKPFYLFTF